MSIIFTKEKGWEITNPTPTELEELVQLGKKEVLKQASLQTLKRKEFLENLEQERFFKS
jgi:hypothetical protein